MIDILKNIYEYKMIIEHIKKVKKNKQYEVSKDKLVEIYKCEPIYYDAAKSETYLKSKKQLTKLLEYVVTINPNSLDKIKVFSERIKKEILNSDRHKKMFMNSLKTDLERMVSNNDIIKKIQKSDKGDISDLEFNMCLDGAFTNMYSFVSRFSSITLSDHIVDAKTELIEAVARKYISDEEILDEYNIGNEVHMVNSLRNYVSTEYGIETIEDTMAQNIDLKFLTTFEEVLKDNFNYKDLQSLINSKWDFPPEFKVSSSESFKNFIHSKNEFLRQFYETLYDDNAKLRQQDNSQIKDYTLLSYLSEPYQTIISYNKDDHKVEIQELNRMLFYSDLYKDDEYKNIKPLSNCTADEIFELNNNTEIKDIPTNVKADFLFASPKYFSDILKKNKISDYEYESINNYIFSRHGDVFLKKMHEDIGTYEKIKSLLYFHGLAERLTSFSQKIENFAWILNKNHKIFLDKDNKSLIKDKHKDDDGNTLLHLCSSSKDALKAILKKQDNIITEYGSFDKKEKKLLDNNMLIEVMKKNSKGETVLDLSASYGTLDVFFNRYVFFDKYAQTGGIYNNLSKSNSDKEIIRYIQDNPTSRSADAFKEQMSLLIDNNFEIPQSSDPQHVFMQSKFSQLSQDLYAGSLIEKYC